jgi:hypothetical protein
MLAVAITIYALRPQRQDWAGRRPAPPAPVQAVSDSDIQARIDAAVARAVAQSEARQTEKTAQLVAELEHTRQRLIWAADEFDISQKRANVRLLSAGNYGLPSAENGEVK